MKYIIIGMFGYQQRHLTYLSATRDWTDSRAQAAEYDTAVAARRDATTEHRFVAPANMTEQQLRVYAEGCKAFGQPEIV